MQYLVSTYDPVSDNPNDGMYWRARKVCPNKRCTVAFVHRMEDESYDRQVSILVEAYPDRCYPPVALGHLNDRSGWRWLDAKPDGWLDWTLTSAMVVLAIPVFLTFGSLVWFIRLFDRKAGA